MTSTPPLHRRQLVAALAALATTPLGTGCWGSFSLTGKVYDWNGSFDSKWASWGVFLVFILLPVYSALLFIDAILLNTIEFFSGENPVKRTADLGGNQRLVLTPVAGDPDAVDVEHFHADRRVRSFRVHKTPRGLNLGDGRGDRLRLHAEGDEVVLYGPDGATLAMLDRSRYRQVVDDVRRGAHPADAVTAALDSATQGRLLALSRDGQIGTSC